MSFNTANAQMNVRSEYGGQSIMKALEDFLASYARMSDLVMVPSLLKDRDVTVHFEKGTTSKLCKRSQSNQLMDKGELVISNGKTEVTQVDLHSFYRMLHAVRQEIVCGPSTMHADQAITSGQSATDSALPMSLTAPMDDDEQLDEQSIKLAALFRQHMQGLFTVLHQMTDASEFVAKKYTEDMVSNAS